MILCGLRGALAAGQAAPSDTFGVWQGMAGEIELICIDFQTDAAGQAPTRTCVLTGAGAGPGAHGGGGEISDGERASKRCGCWWLGEAG